MRSLVFLGISALVLLAAFVTFVDLDRSRDGLHVYYLKGQDHSLKSLMEGNAAPPSAALPGTPRAEDSHLRLTLHKDGAR